MKIVKIGMTCLAAIALVGCATKQVNYSGLEASVNGVEGDAFGQCMAESHRASIKLDMAKEHLARLQGGSNSTNDLDQGETAIAAAAAHRMKAEAGCDGYLSPIVTRVVALEAAAVDLDARVTELERVREIIRGVTFNTGSAKLTTQAKAVLDVVANRLQRSPRNVEVGGHASSTGSPAMNMKLSQARADSVKKYLVGLGVDSSILSARGYGVSQPIADNATAAGRRANQRIELTYGN